MRMSLNQSGPWSLRVFGAGTFLAFALVALLPVLCAFMPPLPLKEETAKSWFQVLSTVQLESRQWALLENSLGIALGTTLVASVLGVAAGLLLEYVRVPTGRLLAYGMASSFLIPSYISAVAWIDLLGKNGLVSSLVQGVAGIKADFLNLYSLTGVIFVLAMSYYPVVALVTALAVRRFDWRLEEAALLAGTSRRALIHVTLPLLLPSILCGSLFVFILSLVSFSVPSLLTVNVYTVEIYSRFSSFHHFQEGAALALPLLFWGGAAVFLWTLLVRRGQAWLTGARKDRTPQRSRRWVQAGAACFCWALVCLSAVLPMLVLLERSLPFGSFVQAIETAKEEMLTSLVVAAGSATVLCVLGFSMAYLGRRGRGRLYDVSFLPFLVSGPVLGIGLIRLWNHSGLPALVYDSLAIIILACAARYLVFAHQGAAAAIADLHPGMEEATSVHGVGWLRQTTGIVIPMLSPALIGMWGLAFVFSMAELDAVILVYPPGFTTLPVRLFTLMHYGPSHTVAALSLLTVIIILSLAGLVAYLYGRTRRMLDAGR